MMKEKERKKKKKKTNEIRYCTAYICVVSLRADQPP